MIFWLKYGTQADIRFPMVKRGVVDLAVSADWTPAAADSAISKDGGNFADTTNTVAIIGGTPTRSVVGWKLTLSATEMQAAEIDVQIVDAATKAVEDQFLTIYTYGNASAKFAGDWSDLVRMGLTALPNANAGAAGGLWILGANAAATTTLTGVAASGATPATAALQLTGGAASTTGGGVAAQALLATGGAGAGSTNGAAEGVKFIGGGTNTVASAAHGLNVTGTSTGSGLNAGSGGGATGNGITATANSTNGSGATLTHAGSGSDLNATTTPLTLAKTTNITGFNDIAATAVVSAGAITTSGGAVSTVTAVTNGVTVTTNNDKTGYALTAAYDPAKTAAQAGDAMALTGGERTTVAGVINTTAITEAYRANGAAPTPAQFMSEVLGHLSESAISGTTKTVKKFDHSTTAETFTLDDAVNPNSITRAT